MYDYIKYLILVIFSIYLCIEDIKYKQISIKTFIVFYLITFIFFAFEILSKYFTATPINTAPLLSYLPIIIICFLSFILCYKKIIPIGEGDILFIFLLFFYFSNIEVFSILFVSLFITFIVSIIAISINLILHKKLVNKSIPFIPSFLPGIFYFIGEKLCLL